MRLGVTEAVWVGGPNDGKTEVIDVVTAEQGFIRASVHDTRKVRDIEPSEFGPAHRVVKMPVRRRKPNFTSTARYGVHYYERLS